MKIQLHKAQYEIATDLTRFKIVRAGRRFGKTVLSSSLIAKWAGESTHQNTTGEDIIYPIIAPTLDHARTLYWERLKLIFGSADYIAHKDESRSTIRLKNNSLIMLYGSDKNPDKLRGIKNGGFIVDEVDSIRNWDTLWQEVIRPSTTDLQAPGLFIGTPKGYANLFKISEMEKKDKDYKAFHYTSYDNPFLPREEIEKAKLELDEDSFGQEYLAEYKHFTGLVYKDFKREKHVITPIELQYDWAYYRGVDFGFVHPTGVIFMAINSKGVIYIYDEIYQSGLQTPDLANLIKQKTGGRNITLTVADSAQQSDIAELQKYGIGVVPVSKTSGTREEDWTSFKIRRVTEKLRNDKLFVFNNCVNTINEFESYQYHEVNNVGMIKETPMKINDHLMDALAYVVVNLSEWVEPSQETFDINDLPSNELFAPGGFY